MKNILFLIAISVIFSFNLTANLHECIQNAISKKQICAYQCVADSECANNCPSNYIVTPCMEKCSDIEKIKDCINWCNEERSASLNACLNNIGLHPEFPCPSCGMDF